MENPKEFLEQYREFSGVDIDAESIEVYQLIAKRAIGRLNDELAKYDLIINNSKNLPNYISKEELDECRANKKNLQFEIKKIEDINEQLTSQSLNNGGRNK